MFGQVVTNSRFSGSLPPGNTVAGQFKQAAALAAASTKQEVNGASRVLSANYLPKSPAVKEAQALIELVAGSEEGQRVARETILGFLNIAEQRRQKAA